MDNSNGGMGGKTVLITGGTSGIGKATAVALAAMGADVVIVGRNPERGRAALEEIGAHSHSESVELMLADLCAQAEVRRLAEEFLERYDRLDVLANNAGLVQSKRSETPDDIETTLATNHLAPFMRSPEQGADTLIWLASSPEVEGVSGKYFSDRKEIEAKKVAYDPAARRRLWEISEDLTGLKVTV